MGHKMATNGCLDSVFDTFGSPHLPKKIHNKLIQLELKAPHEQA